MTKKPTPVIGFHREHRVDGTPFMRAIVPGEIIIPAGSELHLRRLHSGRIPDSPEFALVVIPRTAALSSRERSKAVPLDGSALRNDPRDERTTTLSRETEETS